MMKYVKLIIELFIIGFLPGMLIFIGENDTIPNWFVKHNIFKENRIEYYQSFSFVIGLTFSALILPFQHNLVREKKNRLKEKNEELLKEYKNKFIENLKSNIGQHNTTFYVRIFEPEKGIVAIWNSFWHKKIFLKLKYYKGITDKFEHKTLKFEVSKKSIQGVVGKSYAEKAIYIDTDLNNNNYELTDAQKIKIGETEFCAAIPIFNDNENKIVKILSIDSPNKINLDSEQRKKFVKQIKLLAAFIDKYLK